MTSTTPINVKTAATGPAKGSQNTASQPAQAGGLMGFLTILLQNNTVAAAQKVQAGTQGAAETAQDLAAKISDLMAQNGGKLDEKALAQILPPDMLKAITNKLQAFGMLSQGSDIAPTLLDDTAATGLTSDLSSANATTAQDADLMQALAAQLNAVAPGSDEQDTAATDTDIVAGANDDMMATLLSLQDDSAAQQPASPLALQAAGTEDKKPVVQALHTSTSAAQKASLLASSGLTADASSGEPAAGDARGTSSHIDINVEAAAKAIKQAPAINTPAASLALQLQQVAPQNTQQQSSTALSSGLGSTLGTLGNSLSGDSSLGGGFDQGFGGQHGLAGDASGLDGSSADARLTTGNGSFTTYLNAAGKAAGTAATTQMVGVQISRNANAKIDTFTMQLNPADLGSLEVRMSFGKDGKVSAKLIADKPETLSLLQRDSMHLQRILEQSGLDIAENALSFDLRDQNQQSLYDGTGESRDGSSFAGRGDRAHRAGGGDMTAQLAIQSAGYISQTGVNIMV